MLISKSADSIIGEIKKQRGFVMKELYLGKPYEKQLDTYFYAECLFRLIEMPNDLYDELCVGDYIDPACIKSKKLKLSNIDRYFDLDTIKERFKKRIVELAVD